MSLLIDLRRFAMSLQNKLLLDCLHCTALGYPFQMITGNATIIKISIMTGLGNSNSEGFIIAQSV